MHHVVRSMRKSKNQIMLNRFSLKSMKYIKNIAYLLIEVLAGGAVSLFNG